LREHTVAQLMAAPMSLTDAGLKRPGLDSGLSVRV
jgi:hypothetical protein